MTYRSFCEPPDLLKLLIERYHIPLPDADNIENRIDPLKREGIKRFKANYVSPIQLRWALITNEMKGLQHTRLNQAPLPVLRAYISIAIMAENFFKCLLGGAEKK